MVADPDIEFEYSNYLYVRPFTEILFIICPRVV